MNYIQTNLNIDYLKNRDDLPKQVIEQVIQSNPFVEVLKLFDGKNSQGISNSEKLKAIFDENFDLLVKEYKAMINKLPNPLFTIGCGDKSLLFAGYGGKETMKKRDALISFQKQVGFPTITIHIFNSDFTNLNSIRREILSLKAEGKPISLYVDIPDTIRDSKIILDFIEEINDSFLIRLKYRGATTFKSLKRIKEEYSFTVHLSNQYSDCTIYGEDILVPLLLDLYDLSDVVDSYSTGIRAPPVTDEKKFYLKDLDETSGKRVFIGKTEDIKEYKKNHSLYLEKVGKFSGWFYSLPKEDRILWLERIEN